MVKKAQTSAEKVKKAEAAKEYHNLRYTREKGKSKMEANVGLTLACLNIKKLVKMMTGKTYNFTQISQYYWFMGEFGKNIKKTNIKNDVCLHSEKPLSGLFCSSFSVG